MANRIRQIDEKVQPVQIALAQINVEAAARKAGVPPRTLGYDLKKVEAALPDILANRTPGPKPRCRGVVTAPTGGKGAKQNDLLSLTGRECS
jgi:hypothetical protein